MIDIIELKNESKHAVGFKNNFYRLQICYTDNLNDVCYSFYDWKNKVDLMNTDRLCSKIIKIEIPNENKKKGIELTFENYGNLLSFARKYNDTYRKGFTPFFLKIIYRKQTREKTILSLDYKFF